MKKIKIKGTIISNDDKWIYNLFGMDSTAPKDIVLPETGEDVEVTINSGGGDVYAGSEIYTALRDYAGAVNVKIAGIAASAASVIAMAGNKVSISPTAQLMIHNVASVVQGDYRGLEHESNVLKNYNKSIANAYTAKTGKDMDDLLALMNEETWFTAEEAVEQGFCDEVMFTETAPKLVASASTVIPPDTIDKLANAMKPQFNLDQLAEQVAEKLEEKSNTKNQEPKAEKSGFMRFFF